MSRARCAIPLAIVAEDPEFGEHLARTRLAHMDGKLWDVTNLHRIADLPDPHVPAAVYEADLAPSPA